MSNTHIKEKHTESQLCTYALTVTVTVFDTNTNNQTLLYDRICLRQNINIHKA